MTRTSIITLIALASTSLLSACSYTSGTEGGDEPAVCEVQDCTDGADSDSDGSLDCEDMDLDGDGLRNVWDAAPRDGQVALVLPGGLGTDGELIVRKETAFSPVRTRLVGAAAAGATSLRVQDALDFAEGQEILVLSLQGEGAGSYASAYVAAVDADLDTLTIEPPLAADITGEVVTVQVVPGYTAVEITGSGSLVTDGWDGTGGGVVALRALGEIVVAGAVVADAAGFTGAPGVDVYSAAPEQGESWSGLGDDLDEGVCNEGGGGAAVQDDRAASSGGGGGYGSEGDYGRFEDDDDASAEGGLAYGDEALSLWYFGSGGGAGAPDASTLDGRSKGNISGGGGAGGGIVLLYSEGAITVSGAIGADGEAGLNADSVGAELGGGGGGSGGQIYLGAPIITVERRVSAIGGQGGSAARSTADGEGVELVCENADTNDCLEGRGGAGGVGRIRFDRDEEPGDGEVVPDPHREPFPTPERFPCDADGDLVISAACLPALDPSGDCDDLRPDVFPGAPEVPGDGVDQDCDDVDPCPEDDEPRATLHGNDTEADRSSR